MLFLLYYKNIIRILLELKVVFTLQYVNNDECERRRGSERKVGKIIYFWTYVFYIKSDLIGFIFKTIIKLWILYNRMAFLHMPKVYDETGHTS